MIAHTQRLIEFLGEHDLTLRQFMLCWILYLDHKEYKGQSLPFKGRAIANVYRYAEKVGPWPDDEIDDLVRRGYLVDMNSGSKIYPDNLQVTGKFVKAVFTTKTDFERFVNAYPDFASDGDIGTEETALKAVDMERVEAIFEQKVTSKAEFSRLLTALKWACEKGKLTMNIRNYLSGELWKAHLRQMQQEDSQSTFHPVIN